MSITVFGFSIEIYRDPVFVLRPYTKLSKCQGWEVNYFGYRWAITIEVLWWELLIVRGSA